MLCYAMLWAIGSSIGLDKGIFDLDCVCVGSMGHGEGLARAWRGHGEGLTKAWRRLGEGLAEAWRRLGEGLAKAWRKNVYLYNLDKRKRKEKISSKNS